MKNLKNKIYCGECCEVMDSFDPDFINLTVTSPPYDGIRDYKGYTFDFRTVAHSLYRVTKEGGVVVWVVGDQTVNGSESLTSFKQAVYFVEEVGFRLHDTMIYEKRSRPPQNSNRYDQAFEYMFVFSKGKPKTFHPITKIKTYEDRRKVIGVQRGKDGIHQVGSTSRSRYKTMGNIWTYRTAGGQSAKDKIAYKHPAIFPEQLAEDHILSWTNMGDLVLDPMCGSGTTCKMAKINGRDYIGIDISPEYVELANERLGLYKRTKPDIRKWL